MKAWPGTPYPLGAAYDGAGTHFSLFSDVARRVELCLFDDAGRETRVDLPDVSGHCWHGSLPLCRWPERAQRRRQRTLHAQVHRPPALFRLGGDRHLRRPWHETVIYELHVKGFTARPSS